MIIIGRKFDKTRLPTQRIPTHKKIKATKNSAAARFIYYIILNMPQTIWNYIAMASDGKEKLLCIWLTCNILLLDGAPWNLFCRTVSLDVLSAWIFHVVECRERECWQASSPQISHETNLSRHRAISRSKHALFFLYMSWIDCSCCRRFYFFLHSFFVNAARTFHKPHAPSGCGFPRQAIRQTSYSIPMYFAVYNLHTSMNGSKLGSQWFLCRLSILFQFYIFFHPTIRRTIVVESYGNTRKLFRIKTVLLHSSKHTIFLFVRLYACLAASDDIHSIKENHSSQL